MFKFQGHEFINTESENLDLQTRIAYPESKQKEHRAKIFKRYVEEFGLSHRAHSGAELVRELHLIFRLTKTRIIKSMISFYLESDTIILDTFLNQIANDIKIYLVNDGISPSLIEKIIDNSGIKDLAAYKLAVR